MQQVLHIDRAHRYLRLKAILQDKCRNITEENLELIMSQINVNRIYLIKSTTSVAKFLNIATAENIYTPDQKTLSYILPILGKFESGYYSNINSEKFIASGRMDSNRTCAAVKMSISTFKGHLKTTYTLAIYIPQ